MDKKISTKEILYDIGAVIIGSILFGIAYNLFYTPGGVFTGGAGGIALTINRLTGFPTGISIILINIPLAILFVIFYGLKTGIKSIIGTFTTSITIDLLALLKFDSPVANPQENSMLCAVFGAISLGFGIGILFTRGYSTGGSDYVAFLLRLKFKRMPVSRLLMIIDICVIIAATIITSGKNFMMPLFSSVVAILVETFVIEYVTNDHNRSKIAYVFTEKYEELANAISFHLDRGVTLLDGTGWYTKESKKVVMVVLGKNQEYRLKTLAKSIDPKSFLIMCDATETIGEGFKQHIYETEKISPREKKEKKQ